MLHIGPFKATIYCKGDSYAKEWAVNHYNERNGYTYEEDNIAPIINNLEITELENSKKKVKVLAEDDNENVGLSKYAYSFDGGTSWQEEDSKIFENIGNTTICVRDAVGNIALKNISDTNYIIINNLPTKTTYGLGNELNLEGGSIFVKSKDEILEEINLNDERIQVSGFDSSKEGEQVLTISYNGMTADFIITVVKALKELISFPEKTLYSIGEDLDLTGGLLKNIKDDGTIEEIPLDDPRIEVIGFDSSIEGEQIISIRFDDFTINYTITIKNTLKSISLEENPTRLNYLKGELPEVIGGKILAEYADGTIIELDLSLGKSSDDTAGNFTAWAKPKGSNKAEKIKVQGYDPEVAGEQTIIISYTKDGIEKTTSFNINVFEECEEIEFVQKYSILKLRRTYIKGQELSWESYVRLKAKYNDESIELLDLNSFYNNSITISGYDKNQIGEQLVTVSYGGQTIEVVVTVVDRIKELKLTTKPNKLVYRVGENFDLDVGVITLVFEEGG